MSFEVFLTGKLRFFQKNPIDCKSSKLSKKLPKSPTDKLKDIKS